MSTISVAQLIFTRVESAYSSQKKNGFQTVYKTESLSSTDVNIIEKRIQCFQPYQPAPVRRQFFTLNDGAIVLTYTTQIEAHPEIIDKSRRKGAFLTHCLILDKTEFNKIDYNPFLIFDHYRFINDPEDMVATFGKATGIASIEYIEVEQQRYSIPSCTWSGSEVQKLILLATQAEQLSKQERSVFLLGKEDDINETLRIVFHLLPKNKRLLCMFDTCIDGCSIQRGSYWAVGATRRQSENYYIEVKTTEQRVVSQIKYTSENQDLYMGWLEVVSSQENFKTVMERAYTIQMLSTAFTERIQPNLDEFEENVCQEFIRLHKHRVMSDLEVALSKATGRKIAGLLSDSLYRANKIPILLSIAASQNTDTIDLSSLVADYIIREKPDWDEDDWKILRNLAQQENNMHLLYLSATLGKKVDKKARDKALLNMDENTFLSVLDLLMNPIEPSHFVTSAYLPVLLENSRLNNMIVNQFIDLVKAIIKVNASEHLDSLAGYVETMDENSLTKIEKITKKQSAKIPQKFKAAINARCEKSGKPLHIFNFFRK